MLLDMHNIASVNHVESRIIHPAKPRDVPRPKQREWPTDDHMARVEQVRKEPNRTASCSYILS
jgi:hypothetical protein